MNVKKRADIKVGFLCNNRCKFCAQGNKRKIFGNKPTQQIKEELEKARQICNEVVFTGGEPTLHKDFLKFVEYAKRLEYEVIQIQSNGRMFAYKSFCKETIKAGANEFALALHGHIPSLHDHLTSSQGSFGQTVNGIRNLKLMGQRVITNTVITKSNFRHLPEIAKLLIYLNVDQFQFAFVHPIERAKENFESIVPRMKMIMPYVKKGLEIGIKAGKGVMTEGIPYCLMQGYEDYVAEKIIPETKIFESDFIVESYTDHRQKEGKKKVPFCKKCKYYMICEGPWREYPERFGWGEFKPVL